MFGKQVMILNQSKICRKIGGMCYEESSPDIYVFFNEEVWFSSDFDKP